MIPHTLPGIGILTPERRKEFLELPETPDGLWRVGEEGLIAILATRDRKVEFLVFEEKTLARIKSALGPDALYPLWEDGFSAPAEAVLMDLDGTSVRSEQFWMGIIEKTIARLMGQPSFKLDSTDEPHVSGHSVSEHLHFCIDKYCPGRDLAEARRLYYETTEVEVAEIVAGRGRPDAFHPSPGLREFLSELKARGIKIGLVTSGLYQKAWPEILSAFRVLGLGNPLDFYDAIITAGARLARGQTGTLGELAPKPHPWLYAETAYVGLDIKRERRHRVIGLEDSGAGVVSLRLAGFAVIGLTGGNIPGSGMRPLLRAECGSLLESLPVILGQH
jgi:beta-phosphoglucomutase-like phosphatase (HAD superfamily)